MIIFYYNTISEWKKIGHILVGSHTNTHRDWSSLPPCVPFLKHTLSINHTSRITYQICILSDDRHQPYTMVAVWLWSSDTTHIQRFEWHDAHMMTMVYDRNPLSQWFHSDDGLTGAGERKRVTFMIVV